MTKEIRLYLEIKCETYEQVTLEGMVGEKRLIELKGLDCILPSIVIERFNVSFFMVMSGLS